MLRALFRLAPERVLVEQIRLLVGNVGASVVPTLVLSSVMVWALHDDQHAWLPSWALCVVASKLMNALHARIQLHREMRAERTPRLVLALMVLNGLDGLAWGALPWVSLDHASVAGQVLVIAVMAGVTSNAMSVLAPVLPVFLAFSFCAVAALAGKLLLMENAEYHTLAYVAVLYVLTNVVQGRVAAAAARAAIDLRFENLELIGRLREEAERAQTAHQAAQLANLAKSKFLAAASHDLRQPIHALGLHLEVIGKDDLSAMQRVMLVNAVKANKASSEMLNTLLDFSRIEAGVVEARMQVFRLQEVVTRVEDELAPLAMAKGLVFRIRETRAVVQSDPVLVEQILRNLVSNAIRYAKAGGVLIGCRRRSGLVSLEVWDTGIGIAPEQQQDIFREFHQLGNPERDRSKGLGLGLSIVDGLIKVLGCRLELASRSGQGSVFRLLLSPADGQAERERPSSPPLHDIAHEPGLMVLVIDDDEAVRIGMIHILQSWGCVCTAAESIEQALDACADHRPDLVICDYRLREQRNGAEAIGLLRQRHGADLPALLVTGDTAPQRLREAQSSGIPILHKPVLPAVLRKTMTAMLAPGGDLPVDGP